MSWIKRARAYLNNSEIDIRERLFMLLAVVALAGMVGTVIIGFFIGENSESLLTTLGGVIVFGILAWIGFHFNKIVIISYIVAFLLVACLMPIIFFTSGGVHGGALAYCVFDTVYVVLIIKGKPRVFFLVLESGVAVAMYYLSYLFPELVLTHSEEEAWADSLASMIVVSILLSIMLGFQMYLYRRENEITLHQKNEIDELNRAQNRFFSSMSHEIRTPINTIIGLNEMILRENASGEINEDAEQIESASKMLLHLINDILDMSKFNSGQMTLNPTSYYLGDMISDVADMIWVKSREKGLHFEVDVSPSIPEEIMGDEMRTKQILINVLNNAVKYTKEGSVTLTVSSEELEDRQVNIVYTVSDTGIGIRKESIPFLFDAFKRVDEGKNALIEGTGLGLSIVKQLVDLMGGQITVNSVYTKGSTFTIEIPARRVGERSVGEMGVSRRHAGERPAYQVSFTAPKAHVLVVDDTSSNLLVAQKLLRDTKIQLTCAESAAEALEYTLESAFDVIFMDHLMPEMDGIECLHRIRTQTGGLCKESRVVALTANAGVDNATLYAREGFDGYVVKPVTGRMLENELYRLLPRELVTITDKRKDIEEKSSLWRDVHEMKAMVAVSTDSVADIPRDFLEMHDVAVIPCKVETDGGVFRDGLDITMDGVLRYLEDAKRPLDMLAPETEEYVSFFAERLREARTVIHLSAMSQLAENTYRHAKEAAESFNDVILIDTGNASGAQGMLVMEAIKMAENGMSPVWIQDRILELKEKIENGFIVGSLAYLINRGRVRRSVSNITRSFMLHPVIAARHGKLSMRRLHMGSREHVWKRYIRYSLRREREIDKQYLIVVYIGLEGYEREWIREEIEKHIHFNEIRFIESSSVVAMNVGPGSFAMAFCRK